MQEHSSGIKGRVFSLDANSNQQWHRLHPTDRRLDAKKDLEVSQGKLGDRFSRSGKNLFG